ncbi:hypothetical protein D9M68_224590 [compost metagenome]
MEDGAQVDIDEEIDVAILRLQKFLRPVDAGIVHQNVELNFTGKLRQCGTVGYVDCVRNAAGALGKCLQRIGATGNRMHLEALAAEPLDDRSTDPGGCARHECGSVIGKGHFGSPVVERESSEAFRL